VFLVPLTHRPTVVAAALLVVVVLGTAHAQKPPVAPTFPKGLAALIFPEDNPHQEEKVELGKQLYFDKRLSKDNTISCASCHDPDKGWSNGEAFATGVRGQVGGRSSPSIVNSAYSALQFWDGRASQLEGQALGPISNPIEMDMPIEDVIAKLNKIEGYKKQFQAIYKTDVTAPGIAKALSAFERTILSGDAPYDRFKAGDTKAMSAQAQRGMKIFFGKANCSACHTGHSFSDFAFHNLGIGMDKDQPDLGRFVVTKIEGDKGAFKTPTLREIARTAPYMHDGRFKTLEDVVDYYNKGGHPNPQLDEEIFELKLTKEDQADLVKFLKEGLSSETYPHVKPPKLPE
jgi:cytochrome c peroxidase